MGGGESEVQQWGKGAMEGCGSHRPFHHPDTETMATVPKVTRGAERKGVSLGGRKLREDGMQRGNPKERATQMKAKTEPGRPGSEVVKEQEGRGRRSRRKEAGWWREMTGERNGTSETERGQKPSPGNDSDRDRAGQREEQRRRRINPPPTPTANKSAHELPHKVPETWSGTLSCVPGPPQSLQCLAPSAMSWISWDMAVPSLLLAKQR